MAKNSIREPKINLKDTGTYIRLKELIVKDAISALPNVVFDILGFKALDAFQEALIKMREQGATYLVYDNTTDTFYYATPVNTANITNFYVTIDNKKQVVNDTSKVLIFGDKNNSEKGKFTLTEEQERDITIYERTLLRLDSDYRDSILNLFLVDGYDQISNNPERRKKIAAKVEGINNRTLRHTVILDKEDSYTFQKRDIQDIRWMVDLLKEKICLNHGYNSAKLFGDTPSGLNSTGEGDRRNSQIDIRFFQAVFVFPNLVKMADILGKSEAFKSVKLEPIEAIDKQTEANIQSIINTEIISSYSAGLLPKSQATKLTNRLFNLDNNQGDTTNG